MLFPPIHEELPFTICIYICSVAVLLSFLPVPVIYIAILIVKHSFTFSLAEFVHTTRKLVDIHEVIFYGFVIFVFS